MKIKIGNKYKIRYGNWVSDGVYELIDKAYNYVIGFNSKCISIRDNEMILGWSSSKYRYKNGGKYDQFWCVNRSELVEYSKAMEIE